MMQSISSLFGTMLSNIEKVIEFLNKAGLKDFMNLMSEFNIFGSSSEENLLKVINFHAGLIDSLLQKEI